MGGGGVLNTFRIEEGTNIFPDRWKLGATFRHALKFGIKDQKRGAQVQGDPLYNTPAVH